MSGIPTDPVLARLLFKAIAWLEVRTNFVARPSATGTGTWFMEDLDSRQPHHIQLTCRPRYIHVEASINGVTPFTSVQLWPGGGALGRTVSRIEFNSSTVEVEVKDSNVSLEERLEQLCKALGV